MARIISPASLVLDAGGTPYAPLYDDVYHSRAGGYAQANEVFMAGNRLPQAWGGRQAFAIVEIGFGLGTNFLATWAAWRADPRRPARLDFVAIELHPFNAADLRGWHARDPEIGPLAAQLAAAWPVLTPGIHRIALEQERVVLTLVLDEAGAALANLRLRADAFYLDGFAPARNPEAWSRPVFHGMARLAAPGATVATYTVARMVADGLTAAGFAVRKAPGFGGKRDMLVGQFAPRYRVRRHEPPPAPHWPERHALVIGAGIAGVAAADSLAARGWRVSLLDSAAGLARGGSGTPAGAVHALLARDDSRLARMTRAAFLYMDRRLAQFAPHQAADWYGACGRVDCAADAYEEAQAGAVIAALGLPPDFVRAIDAAAASELAGTRVARGGYWFARGAWLHAGGYCAAVLAARAGRIRLHAGSGVDGLRREGEHWSACDAAGRVLASAPVAVLAAGVDLATIAGAYGSAQVLPLRLVRGQLTGLPAAACRAPRVLVSGEGYCLPPVAGRVWTGASYGPGDADPAVREEEQRSNLRRLAQLLPDNDFGALPADCAGHVGFRAVAPDRLPLVGALPDLRAIMPQAVAYKGEQTHALPRHPGLYVSGGMASRGLTWAALAGETLASLIEGEPPPLEADLLDAVDPARFLQRHLRRAGPAE